MEFQYHGGNCISITTKNARLVVDDNLSELGLKSVVTADTIALYTTMPGKTGGARLSFTDPGEYEASGISIFGVAARAHIDEKDQATAVIYRIQTSELRVGVVGHVHPDLSEDFLEELGAIDILFIPVGGNGYTLDGVGALSIIKKIEPKIVVPTHYADDKISYPVPQQSLGDALKGLAIEVKETYAKFKPKPADFTGSQQLIVLERQ